VSTSAANENNIPASVTFPYLHSVFYLRQPYRTGRCRERRGRAGAYSLSRKAYGKRLGNT